MPSCEAALGEKNRRLPTKVFAFAFPEAVAAGTLNGGMNPQSLPAVKHYSHFIKDAPPQQAALYAARLPSITATSHKIQVESFFFGGK